MASIFLTKDIIFCTQVIFIPYFCQMSGIYLGISSKMSARFTFKLFSHTFTETYNPYTELK